MKEPKKPEDLLITGMMLWISKDGHFASVGPAVIDADEADELATWLNQYSLWKRWKDGQGK